MGAITQLDFTTSWEQSHSWILPPLGSNHSWILPSHRGNHTAGFYQVMGVITQLILPPHGSNHTAGFYHLMGAITQLDFTTS